MTTTEVNLFTLDEADGQVLEVAVTAIVPAADNLRRDLGDLKGLTESVKSSGIIAPLVVTAQTDEDTTWQLIAGHRRLEAAKLAGLEFVPCFVRARVDDATRVEMMLIENLQREGLTPIEEATGYGRLVEEFGWSQRKVATTVGCSQPHVSKRLQLMALPEKAQAAIDAGSITIEEGLELAKIKDEPAKIVEIVNGSRSGYYGHDVAHKVREHLRDKANAEAVEKLRPELEAKGLKVILRDPGYDRHLDYLGFTEAKHRPEPCHRALIVLGHDKPKVVYVCSDVARHQLTNGDSKLKLPKGTHTATSKTPAQQEADRAKREATEKRRQVMAAMLVGPTMTDAAIIDLSLRRYLEDAAHDECIKIGRLLELTPIEKASAQGGKDWPGTVRRYSESSAANLKRACLAFALVQGESGMGIRRSFEHLALLTRHGYETTDAELEHTAEWQLNNTLGFTAWRKLTDADRAERVAAQVALYRTAIASGDVGQLALAVDDGPDDDDDDQDNDE